MLSLTNPSRNSTLSLLSDSSTLVALEASMGRPLPPATSPTSPKPSSPRSACRRHRFLPVFVTFRFHFLASEEYRQAALYYAERSRGLGTEFTTRLEQTLTAVQRFPFARHVVNQTGVRQALLRQFPYKLVYVVERDANGQAVIVIYAVAHTRREPGYWNKRLPSS